MIIYLQAVPVRNKNNTNERENINERKKQHKRNYINCVSNNNNSITNISRSKYSNVDRTKWNINTSE